VSGVGEKGENPYQNVFIRFSIIEHFLRKNAVALWKKLQDLYQDKSLVNNFFCKEICFP
jgi:hypothetical protein